MMSNNVRRLGHFDYKNIINKKTGHRHYRVLVVDDEKMIRDYLSFLFSQYGHHCETANNGLEALKIVKEKHFDSAVIDIVMPLMDGIHLTKELLKLYPEFPIMIMTGHAEEHSAESAISAGAREFINKPFSVSEIILRFDKMMNDHKGKEALLTLSLTDELTGLYNRRRFFILGEQYLKVAIRTKKRFSLLYMDMDDLKRINDHYGHQEGDRILVGFAEILQKTFRESDIIARIGGDEFVVLFECSDQNEETLMARLDENIKDFNAKGSQRYQISISVGVAPFDPEHPIPIYELLSKADTSMYAHKRGK